ncbi:hypothetical protein N0V93_001773 [Gnomoniopsis smithogilvyi]|uniref:AB hydrolase-1 domain-containing protein n=1 Tax=Gnomoniopsis smithogilvyi TaxID=1191159 RepID=A0A9W8Z6J8_9PEZI|nr:hypothetical protein N0V93_001773 [Gnomoniopsis smithogilvyi]
MPSSSDSISHPALDFVKDDRMHRELTLPATATHKALNVSYADVGRLPGDSRAGSVVDHPTILLIPGMFASRFLALTLHAIAEKLGVRVLIVDRPGMGLSTNVPLGQRIPIWVDLVPYLLQHLGIKHVSLVSHSAGTTFLLNTLQDCRNVLHPDRPFVALLAPWVDPEHSKNTAMQAARLIPAGAFGVWNLLPKARPVFATSGNFFTGLSNAVFGPSSQGDEQTKNSSRLEADYGVPRQVQSRLGDLVFKSTFAENTVGANSEALLCLKKGPEATWGACQNYDVYFKRLHENEKQRSASVGSDQTRAKLRIRAYFAESDAMIGKKGNVYLTDCIKGGSEVLASDAIDFEASTIIGTDHDTLLGRIDVLEEIFVQAGGHLPESVA